MEVGGRPAAGLEASHGHHGSDSVPRPDDFEHGGVDLKRLNCNGRIWMVDPRSSPEGPTGPDRPAEAAAQPPPEGKGGLIQ